MKLPRFFIVLGACTVVLTFALHFIESNTHPAWAQTVPIQRADPWAGDPEEPGFARKLPFPDDGYSRIFVPYETTTSRSRLERSNHPASTWWLFRAWCFPFVISRIGG